MFRSHTVVHMVQATGLEPAREAHWILNPARLPIPPRLHEWLPQYHIIFHNKCQHRMFYVFALTKCSYFDIIYLQLSQNGC